MSESKLAGFTLERLVSENNLCQSWLARHKRSGQIRFLKIQKEASGTNRDLFARTIIKAYECQRQIRSTRVLTACRRHSLHGRTVMEYTYLDPDAWQPLSAEVLLSGLDSLLPEVALIVDFVHFSGFVHCDLKLDNFMVSSKDRLRPLVLVDLEFIRPDNTAAAATILGTPEHIAPEIRADEAAVAQSDMYSLGVSLRKAVETLTDVDLPVAVDERLPALKRIIEKLTLESPFERPVSLLDALLDHEFVTPGRYERLNTTLLAMLLRSSFLVNRRQIGRGRKHAESLLKELRILGVRGELTGDLQRVLTKSPLRGFGAVHRLTGSADIQRFGRYWAIRFEDEALLDAYLTLNDHFAVDAESRTDIISRADQLWAEKQYEKAYLMLRRAYAEIGSGDSSRQLAWLERLQDLAAKLDRTRDTVELIKESLPLQTGVKALESTYLLVRLLFGLARYDEALETIFSQIDMARDLGEHQWELRFEALSLLYEKCGLDRPSRLRRLGELAEEADRLGYGPVRVAARYNIGCLLWLAGDHRGAVSSVEEANRIAKGQRLEELTGICTAFLAKLYYDMGRYSESQKLIERNLRRERDTFNLNAVAGLLSTGVANLARLGRLDTAMLRNEESMSFASQRLSIEGVLTCLLRRAHILIEQGDLTAARSQLHECLALKGDFWSHRNSGWAHHLIALIALMQGRREECHRHLDLGREIYPESDRYSLRELDFLDRLERMVNGGEDCSDDLLEIHRELAEQHSVYYAAWAAFHLLLSGRYRASGLANRDHFLELAEASPEVPMFRAVSALIGKGEDDDTDTPSIPALKEALQAFDLTRSKFLGLVLCETIGLKYQESGREALAARYFEAALRLARGLGNEHLVERLSRRLREIEDSASSQKRLRDSVRSISDILSQTGNYRESLKGLVSFAVEHTGAERGVLLLRNERGGNLRAIASVNCDDFSCSDIERFSSSIPGTVARSAQSLIVDNAQDDQRTAGFKSIAIHNILSVVCVPVNHQGRVLGALYLDHHSVPSLFREQDLAWIETIANFVGVALATAQTSRKLHTDHQRMIGELQEAGRSPEFLTADPVMQRLLDQLPNIASSSAPVLLVGEPGTGKEILADMIHHLSPRADKPFLKMNCAAVPDDMAESELFGVTRGAATGVSEREGKLSAADEGTLLLDEIGDMPLTLQAKLLRAVEYQSFEQLGSNRTIHVDVRFIYATNKVLGKMVEMGRFRADLLDRIQVIKLQISPLRERPGDVTVLLDHFLGVFSVGRPAPRFSREALNVLRNYRWPGNVRELKNVIEHCSILYPDTLITPDMLPLELDASSAIESKEGAVAAEAVRIRRALVHCNWNKSQAARLLGMHVSSLRRRIARHRIQP